MELHQLLSTDSRNALQRTRRSRLYRIADAYKLNYPPGIPADDLRKIIEGNGIDVLKPLPNGGENDWEQVVVENEDGKQSVQLYPKEKPHFTANREIDYESILAKKAEEQKQTEKENVDLRQQIIDLQKQLKALTELAGADIPSSPEFDETGSNGFGFDAVTIGNANDSSSVPEPDISAMAWVELKKHAKALGVSAPIGVKRPELEAMIRDHISDGSQ